MPPGFEPGPGGVAQLDAMEAASFAWNRVMKDPVTACLGGLIGFLCIFAGGAIAGAPAAIFQVAAQDLARTDPLPYTIVYSVLSLGGQVVSMFITSLLLGGWMKFFLNIAAGKQYSYSDIFGSMGLCWKLLASQFLVGLACALASLLCFFPGIFLGICLSQTNFLIIDKGLGPIEAMQESFRITEGNRLNIFLFGLISFGIGLLGVLACCVGFFVALPVVFVGQAYIYLRLTRQPTASPV